MIRKMYNVFHKYVFSVLETNHKIFCNSHSYYLHHTFQTTVTTDYFFVILLRAYIKIHVIVLFYE